MKHRWIPEYHDGLLRGHLKRGLDTSAIAQAMGFTHSTIYNRLTALGLTGNKKPLGRSIAEKEGPMPVARVDPLAVAQMYLEGFDKETLTLRGRPIKLDDAMRMTNRNLKRLGMSQVAHCPRWLA